MNALDLEVRDVLKGVYVSGESNFQEEIKERKKRYEEMGYSCIPLQPGSKEPIQYISWTDTSSDELWKNARKDSNIGILCGGTSNLLVIDCDDKHEEGTTEKITTYLASLGIRDYPFVQTASMSGHHIYLKCQDIPSEQRINVKNLKPEFGIGDIRFSEKSYVVAPPSKMQIGSEYCLIAGDFRNRPLISFQDILPLIGENKNEVPLITQRRRLPRNAWKLANKKVTKYQSRSEQEYALMISLINSKFTELEILSIFIHKQVGKFWEKWSYSRDSAFEYFWNSFYNAKHYAENHQSTGRMLAEDAFTWANNVPWPGRAGAYDQAVFMAHCQIAFRAGKIEYHASCRELAELAGISPKGATNANKRLRVRGFLQETTPTSGIFAAKYKIGQAFTLPHGGQEGECVSLQKHDVFRYRGLGKTCGQIWETLQRGPKTVDELVKETGRYKKTIQNNLMKMCRIIDFSTGEVISMVESEDEKYSRKSDIDLDMIARLIGTKGMAEKQKERHKHEREIHKKSLEIIAGKEPTGEVCSKIFPSVRRSELDGEE